MASTEYDHVYLTDVRDIHDLFQSVVDEMVLIRIPGDYDGDVYFPD
ncbi:MAG: dihydrofolate reductase [Halobacteriales archaeon]|jgi:dihydrofolate reductase